VNGAVDASLGTLWRCTKRFRRENTEKSAWKIVKHFVISATKEHQIPLTGIGDGKQQNYPQRDQMIDVTKYESVIQTVLESLKVPAQQRKDSAQDCYVALIEATDHLEKKDKESPNDMRYAARICRNLIKRKWSLNNHAMGRDAEVPIQTLSASAPRIAREVAKLSASKGSMIVSDEELYAAIESLPHDQFKVIYSLYVEGNTHIKTAEILGLTKSKVWTIKEHGVENLKRYFEESI
jgi:RNA polymerase sigma factor (sigma-70 family)